MFFSMLLYLIGFPGDWQLNCHFEFTCHD